MHKLLMTVLGIALLALAGNVKADVYFGYADMDFAFQVYSGGNYTYAAMPYTYAYNGYYYFDYPFRVYDSGDYFYYNSGWYNFDPYWRTASNFCATCYSYYSPDYYYYGGYWNYAPGWVGSYGPMYYGSYYMAPGTATLTGQQYHPSQEATCSMATIESGSVTVSAGETVKATFYVNNYSRKYFDVADVTVKADDFGVRISNVKFDSTIANGSIGKVEFDVTADSDLATDTINANVEATGTFRDGTYCGTSEIEGDFSINVAGKQKATTSFTYYDNYGGVQGSTSYKAAKGTQQEWAYVQPATTYRQGTGNSGTGNSGMDSGYNSGSNYAANNNYSGNSGSAGQNTKDVTATYYGKAQFAEGSCGGLGIVQQNVSVASADSVTKYFAFKNFGSENFYIDGMEAVEYSPDYSMEVSRDSQKVYAGATDAIKVRVNGAETEQDSTGTAYITVNGHYASGLNCEVNSENFYVRVDGTDRHNANDVRLGAPQSIGIEGTSGFIQFELDNPTNEQLKVRVYSGSVSVSPSEFTFNAKTLGTRVIAVNGVSSTEARVYIAVESEGSQFLTKYVKVSKMKDAAIPNQPAEDIVAADTGKVVEGVGGLVSTGFSFLADNAVYLGALVLLIVVAFEMIRRQ